jgi:hypothetical protein
MIGRAAALDRIWGLITKPSPSHVSVVGPRYAGKTVFLNALAERARVAGSPYTATILWDLRRQTPQSDESFLKTLSGHLGDQLRAVDEKRFCGHIDYITPGEYGNLREVVDSLEAEGVRILLLLDGLDYPLQIDTLSRNLWDQLREIASRRSFTLVTGSRRRVRELIRTAETATSDFWNIFEPNPVQIGVMAEPDLKEALARAGICDVPTGVEQQIWNWSGRFPPLMLALLNAIAPPTSGTSVDLEEVNRAATSTLWTSEDILAELWDECPEATKDLYRELVAAGPRPVDGVGWEQRERLTSLGFANERGKKLHKGCRLLEQFIETRRADEGSVARLFQSVDRYNLNIKSILEFRLSHLSNADPDIRRAIEHSIEDIPAYASASLVNMRNIAERAFATIWAAEFGESMRIPSQIFGYWNQVRPQAAQTFSNLDIPGELRPQCRLLQLLVGAEQGIARRAKYFSRQTYHLLNAVVGYGNYGQHTHGESVGLGTAVCAILSSLELAARLIEENSPTR